jgi:hypothetical protein
VDQDAVLGVVVKDGVKGGKQACKHMVQGVGAVWAKRRVVPSEPSRRGGSRIQEAFHAAQSGAPIRRRKKRMRSKQAL